jgi:hypothetical protein
MPDLPQACDKQESCRTAASELIEEWDEFLSISDRVPDLKEMDETREAVKHLLELVAEAADYIKNHTQTRIIGWYPTLPSVRFPS